MNIIVVGCGRVGAELAYGLYKRKHQVTVVDDAPERFAALPADFRGRTVEGEPLAQDVLKRAGIDEAHGLAAVTNFDSINVVVAHVARVVFQVPNVVVRNYDPGQRSLLEAFGVQVISPSSWGAQRIEELLDNVSLHTVFSAGNGEVELYEFLVPAPWHGRTVRDVAAGGCAIIALTRAGRASMPSPDSTLQAGDIVHVAASDAGAQVLCQQLKAREEG